MGYLQELFGTRSKDFVEGMTEGIRLYAHMKDGESFVGTTGKKLFEALEELNEIKGYNEEDKIIKCNSCLKEKKEYINGLCEDCSNAMDKHIEGNKEEDI